MTNLPKITADFTWEASRAETFRAEFFAALTAKIIRYREIATRKDVGNAIEIFEAIERDCAAHSDAAFWLEVGLDHPSIAIEMMRSALA